jgi:hypothetical protein
MVTNVPTHPFAAGSRLHVDDRPSGFVVSFLGWLQRSICALHGHDPILQFERTRIFLRCTSCGHETPGWEVSGGEMVRHRPIDARQAHATRADLAVVRKIA